MDDRDFTVRVAKATAAAVAVAVVALAIGIWHVRSVLILLLLAATLAAAIRPGVERLGPHRVPQSAAILLHFLAVGAAISVAVVGILFGSFAVILAVPVTSAVATLIDVLVLGHEPPTAQPRRPLQIHPTG